MSLIPTEKALCNKLLADWNGLLAPVYAAKSTILKAKNDMINKLKEMVEFDLFTFPPSDLTDALDDFEDQVKDSLPGDELDDLQRIKDFLDNCPYLQSLEPISALIGTVLGISDKINDLISEFFDALNIPEFGAANFGSIIDNLLSALPGLPGGDALADLLAKADDLLQCLDALCALQDPDYRDRLDTMTDELHTLYEDLNVISSGPNAGKFDYDKILGPPPDGIDLTADQKNAILNTKDKLNAAKNNGLTAVNNTKNAIQAATKLGGLF